MVRPVVEALSRPTRAALALLATCAWTLVVIMCASFLAAVVCIAPWPLAAGVTPWLPRRRATGPALVDLVAAGLWGAAVWHTVVDESLGRRQRALLVGTLVVGNVPAALVYYFLWVRGAAYWRGGQDAGSYRARPVQ